MDKELQTKLQTAVTQKTEANEQKELLAQAVDLGIDLTQFGLKEDGTVIEATPEEIEAAKKLQEAEAKKLEEAEALEQKGKEEKDALVASVIDKIKETFQPKEVKTEDKSQIYG